MKKTVIVAIIAFCVSLQAVQTVSEKINTIALFKNGTGYFLSSVDIEEGTMEFQMLPEVAATHGTYWVSWEQAAELGSIISEEIDFHEEIDAVTVAELLKANVGANVKLSVRDDYITGEILSFDEKAVSFVPTPYMPGSAAIIPNITAKMLTVQTDSGTSVIDVHQISGITFLDDDVNRSTVQKTKRVALTGEFISPSPETKLSVSYIGRGITWVPSYIVDISSDDKVSLSAKAIIINEAADIKDAQILLITGYPQLEFANVFSPMAKRDSLAQFIAFLSGSGGASPRSVGVMSNMAKSRASFDMLAEASSPISYGDAAQGRQIEDMFFYPLEKVTLDKDQTGYYPLFSAEVDCKHIYKWDIKDNIDRHYRYNNNQEKVSPIVWHCIKLKNDSEQPWTTAPIQTIKDNLILGQSTLDYTLAGDEATVKITQAGAVKANQVEYVSKRVANSATFFGTTYDEVTIEGTLYVTNTKSQAIEIEVSKMITGKIINTSPEAKIDKTTTNVGQVNETQKLKWNIEIDASDKIELKYSYKAYLRR